MSTSNPDDLGFGLTPPLPGVVNPDLAINAALAPVRDVGASTPAPLGRGWAFDFLEGEFVANGLTPAVVYEADHLRVWIEKTLRTARSAHPVYGTQYGMPDPFRLIGMPYSSELIGEYVEQITDALTVHDRIQSVTNFLFEQDPLDDVVYGSFTVVLDDDDADPLQIDSVPIAGA